MNYEVVWDVVAYRKLEQIWDAAEDLGPAVDAFDEIERRLASDDPDNQGESRPHGRRILIVPPLGVLFRAQPRLKEVYVLDVWAFGPRKQ